MMLQPKLTEVELLARVARRLAEDSHARGLKPAQWQALRYLARANRFSRTPGALTHYLGATKGTVSQTLNALARRGFIEKYGDTDDRRLVRLDLTQKGRDELTHDPLAQMAAAAEGLTPEMRRALAEALERLLFRRLELAGEPPFGFCVACRHFQQNHAAGAPHRCALLEAALTDSDSQKICVEQKPVD